jgi:hypothetical protein
MWLTYRQNVVDVPVVVSLPKFEKPSSKRCDDLTSYIDEANRRNKAEDRGLSCERKWALFRRKYLDHL